MWNTIKPLKEWDRLVCTDSMERSSREILKEQDEEQDITRFHLINKTKQITWVYI